MNLFKQLIFLLYCIPIIASVSVTPISDSISISVKNFNSGTITTETLKKLSKYHPEKAPNIIIDLRNNHGGTLHDAIGFGALFVTKNELIQLVKTDNTPLLITRPKNHPLVTANRLIILINEQTASAAEAAVHILSQHKNSIRIGTHTYGKTIINTEKTPSPYKEMSIKSIHPDIQYEWKNSDQEAIILKALAIANHHQINAK